MTAIRTLPRDELNNSPSARRRLHRGASAGRADLFQVRRVVAVEQRADEPAIEIRRAEQPVGDRERQVHVGLHHQPRVVMGGVMAAQRVDERAVAHEPVLVDVAAEVHELVDQVHARGHAHEQPADVGREQIAEDDAAGIDIRMNTTSA